MPLVGCICGPARGTGRRRPLIAPWPSSPQALWANFYKGCCAFQAGDYEDAVIAFSVCVSLAPTTAWAVYHRGQAYLEQDRLDRARSDFDTGTASRFVPGSGPPRTRHRASPTEPPHRGADETSSASWNWSPLTSRRGNFWSSSPDECSRPDLSLFRTPPPFSSARVHRKKGTNSPASVVAARLVCGNWELTRLVPKRGMAGETWRR